MNDRFYDDVWKRQGISLIWNPDSLATICRSDQVISLYQLFQLNRDDWPDDQLDAMMVENGRALVVAGLESTLDSLAVETIVNWIEQQLYPVMRRFQQNVADGGRGAALIFWIVESRRFVSSSTDPSYHWITRQDNETRIEISRALFNGAADALRTVFPDSVSNRAIGLYHPRIS